MLLGRVYPQIARFADDVTEEIAGIVKQLQELGVPKVLVNSVPPLGCTPWMSRFTNYDHCDKRGNMISDAHNTALLDKLGKEKNVMLLDVNTMFTELVSPKPGMNETSTNYTYCIIFISGGRPA